MIPVVFSQVNCPGKNLDSSQLSNVQLILQKCSYYGVTFIDQQAYILATTQHESIYEPISEWGKGAGQPYGKPDPVTGKTYYGRGFVQLTWKTNYAKFGKLLGIDLVDQPSLALNPTYAAEIIVIGMQKGLFTGVGLSDYITPGNVDYYDARRIVNGLDRASMIEGYAQSWAVCLNNQ